MMNIGCKCQNVAHLNGRYSETCAHAPHAGVRGRHVRVSAEVDVQHGGVGALHQDTLPSVVGRVRQRDRIRRHAHNLGEKKIDRCAVCILF